MIKINIAGTVYEYPEVGENPNWGREATEVIVALADALGSLIADGDILTTQASINNNVSIASIVNGLIFDSNKTRSAIITYAIYRKTDTVTSGNTESGRIFIAYDDEAPIGQKWIMTQIIDDGSAGVIFEVGDDGQFLYRSSDITGSGYTGLITFQAKTLIR